MSDIRITVGDARSRLAELPAESVHCCVTSPPYFGLRDYGTAQWDGGDPACDHKQGRPGAGRADGVVDDRAQRSLDGVGSIGGDCRKCGARRIDRQIGLEASPDEYVAALVAVFREVRRVLRSDGTLWLNLGDSYANDGKWGGSPIGRNKRYTGLKPKDLIGIPWMVAFALRADGWWLRQDIIWSKPNPMPESVTDRCTKAHEYLFLLSKSANYYYDAKAIKEPLVASKALHKSDRKSNAQIAAFRGNAPTNLGRCGSNPDGRNKRSVWTITTKPFPEAHFATFPPTLVEPCVLAGCLVGGTVLDPFAGAGTTGLVADQLGRNAVLIELNPVYAEMARRRIEQRPLTKSSGNAFIALPSTNQESTMKNRSTHKVDKAEGGKRRVIDNNDEVAAMLRGAATDDDLRAIAEKYGLLDKWDGWSHLNRGSRRMSLGNTLRARLRKEAESKIAAAAE